MRLGTVREGKLFPERKTVSRQALRAANKELYSSGTQLRRLITTEDEETAAELRRATRAVLRQACKLDRIQVDPEDWKTRFTKGGLADGYYSNRE